MTKLLLSLSLLSIIILSVGTAVVPNNAMFWLAGNAVDYQYVRLILAGVLLLQLYTKPPRHVIFRFMAGILAVGFGSWAVEMTYTNHMQFLDSLSILAAAFSIMLAALEIKSGAKQAVPAFEPQPSAN